MSTAPRLLVYKASAGSGKTFTLAVQYIKQLIEDPFAYRRILAVTFTNKATAEMKARILEQLYGLSNQIKSSNGYLKALISLTGKDESDIRKSAQQALQNILHDYSRFRIETIDSFFQSVLRNLARELELGANLNIELNQSQVLSDAVDGMMEKLDRKSPVLYWILEYAEERISEDKRWDISDEIKRFGENIFDEKYVEKGNGLRSKLANPQFLPTFRKELHAISEEVLDQMKSFSEQFHSILGDNGLTVTDLANKSKGIASYFNKIGNGELTDNVRNATVEKCLENEENWTTKTSTRKNEIKALAIRELIPLLKTAEEFRVKNNLLLNSCRLASKYLNNLRLLSTIGEEVRAYNAQRNQFLLPDTNAVLHSLISKGDASFIYEKIGSAIDTVMIDEFQDTSQLQWENFHLLLEESLAQKEGSILVGDIKQSIYRWRNGDWKILANLGQDPTLRIDERTLETNWRSESHIIQFNNELFTAACGVLNQKYESEMGVSCPQLTDAYRDVKQLVAKKGENGYVKISFLSDTENRTYREAVLEELVQEVTALIDQGIQTNDIAILIRKNKDISPIADYFDQHTPYRIVSDEAFRLDASLAICMMIDAIRLLVSEDDRIAQARLAIAYQEDILHKGIDRNTLLLNHTESYLPAEFLLRKDSLRFMPLYELLETLFQIFGMDRITQQDAYLCAFYDAVTEYIQNNSSEPAAFLSYWNETLHAKTIPSGEIDGIRILSIHKSKGLEYSTVLIPFCDWSLESETKENLIWCSVAENGNIADISPFNELDLIPINYTANMAQSVYKGSYTDEKIQLWIDSINLLYVAFTRAKRNLIAWGKANGKGTIANILSESMGRIQALPIQVYEDEEQGILTYEYGTLSAPEKAERVSSDNRFNATPEPLPIHIESIEADIDFRQSNQSAQFLKEDSDADTHDYIRQGELMHQVFASIEKASDLPQAIERLCFEGVISSTEQEQQIRELAEWALKNPKAKAWYDGSWQLYNECSIIYTDSNGNLQTRRPDRVMVKNGCVVVVDFKFGKKQEKYQAQVQEYMHLLSLMGYTQIKGYLWYVFGNELEEVNL